ncbi:peptidase S8 [Peribacillus cavernae]|uniref:Peptidase S8 n=1 Tax=Peribacillus cavernae TaxID=1674310 RepID=A0A3S1B8L2_9BACI|nr:S8 family peptidase [Peribacillus cavernae]RUQ30610.1 peptidase S8 [Peribacillus cavernae]
MRNRKKLGAALLSLGIGFSMFAGGIGPVQAESAQKSQDNVRVFINGSKSDVTNAKKHYRIKRNFGSQGFTTTVNPAQLETLKKNKNLKIEKVSEVKIAQTNATAKVKAAAVPSTRTPWGIKAIYNDSSIAKTSGGNGIKVAVLDTGTTKNHIDLASNVEQCKDFTTSSTYVNNSCTDRNGHGTHVSGTVLANGGSDGMGIYGVAPESKLWAYKVLGDNGSGYSDDIAAAIRHTADQSTSTGAHVIISMSLGSSAKDSLITSAVDYAYSKGVLVVAAAGNSGYAANTIGYPGALKNAVAVAALENVQQNGTYRVANFSSRGNPNTDADYAIGEKDVEVSAPGAAIESTWLNNGYNTISGTSMATPHVSGLAAKVWASNPSLTHTQLRAQLQTEAKAVDIKGGYGSATGDDYASGFGFPRVR